MNLEYKKLIDFIFKYLLPSGAFILAYYGRYYTVAKDELKDSKSVNNYIDLLKIRSREKTYRKLLGNILNKASTFFGSKLFGLKSLSRCLFIGIAYPTFLASLIWVITGNSIVPGGFPSIANIYVRILSLIILSGIYTLLYLLIRYDLIENHFDKHLLNKRWIIYYDVLIIHMLILCIPGVLIEYHVLGVIKGIFLIPTVTLLAKKTSNSYGLFIVIFSLLGIANLTNVGIAFIVFAFAIAIGSVAYTNKGSKILKGPSLKSYTGAIAGLLMISINLYLEEGLKIFFEEPYFSVLVLFVVMPLLNSIFDYFSLGLSRYLGERLIKDFSKYKALAFSIIDLILAFVLLISFIMLMVFTINYIDSIYFSVNNQRYFQDWEIYTGYLGSQVNVKSIWIYLMMITTLVPTFIHFGIALSSLFILKANYSKRKEWIVKLTKFKSQEAEVLSAHELKGIINHLFIHRWLWVFVTILILIPLFIYLLNRFLPEFKYLLEKTTLTALFIL